MDKTLEELLNKLEARAEDGFARVVFVGRALSKSKENLHLAVATGVLSIPISEIESISPISDIPQNADHVYVGVKNADRVKHLFRAEQLKDTPGQKFTTGSRFKDSSGRGGQEQWPWLRGGGRDTFTPSGDPPALDSCDDWVVIY